MTIIGARRYGWPRIEFFDTGDLDLKPGMACLVQNGKNTVEFAEVVYPQIPACWSEKVTSPGKVVRRMTDKDNRVFRQMLVKERTAFDLCLKKCQELKVPMKLVRVAYAYDLKHAVFYYTASGRIDFRQLVRELARGLRIRVEMRQIGVRDESRMLRGCGTCGCTLCCSTFLKKFAPVSMKMAKKQNLALNPAKVSGVCGRLKCCLAYEA